MKPVLSFDERGHQKNNTTYFVYGSAENGEKPESFYPTVEAFIGEGGTFLNPEAVRTNKPGKTAGTKIQGKEAVGGLRFSRSWQVQAKRLQGLSQKPGKLRMVRS